MKSELLRWSSKCFATNVLVKYCCVIQVVKPKNSFSGDGENCNANGNCTEVQRGTGSGGVHNSQPPNGGIDIATKTAKTTKSTGKITKEIFPNKDKTRAIFTAWFQRISWGRVIFRS
jgi:hypothetical protein